MSAQEQTADPRWDAIHITLDELAQRPDFEAQEAKAEKFWAGYHASHRALEAQKAGHCHLCEGAGENPVDGHLCRHCRGTGKPPKRKAS